MQTHVDDALGITATTDDLLVIGDQVYNLSHKKAISWLQATLHSVPVLINLPERNNWPYWMMVLSLLSSEPKLMLP